MFFRQYLPVFFLFLFFDCGVVHARPKVVVYADYQLAGPGSLAAEIGPNFEKSSGCEVTFRSVGDAGQLLPRIQLDARQGRSEADLVIGVDQQLWQSLKPWTRSWGDWVPRGYSEIPEKFRLEKGFLPFDFGVFSWIADRKTLKKQGLVLSQSEISLKDLTHPQWKKNLLLEDPRTSTPGLGFLLFAEEMMGPVSQDSGRQFWKAFRSQWLTLTPGWGGAYRLFLKEEAPLVWSYISSQAYHEEKGDSPDPKLRRYQAVLFREGQPYQVEGIALLKKTSENPESTRCARQLMEFLISEAVQVRIPKKLWMMPVRQGTPLPESFQRLPQPRRLVPVQAEPNRVKTALQAWGSIVKSP